MDNSIADRPMDAGIPDLVWGAGAAVLAFVLSQLCMMLWVVIALLLEVTATRAVGLAINGIALLLMVASYSAILVVLMRYLTERYVVPWAAWIGLAAYPVGWGLLAIAFPNFGGTPAIVGGVGVAVAWLSVGRHRSRSVGGGA